jgi:DNA-binding response OmpR family regulator
MTNYQPNLIILDVVINGKSGFKFCLQLKKSKQTCSIPVIICSTKATQADLMLGDMIGADAYLIKTAPQAEFISKAQQLSQQPAVCRFI